MYMCGYTRVQIPNLDTVNNISEGLGCETKIISTFMNIFFSLFILFPLPNFKVL